MNTITDSSTRTSNIHPINANYLLDTEPYKLYTKANRNFLEIVVERFSHTTSEILHSHGGIIAVGCTYWEESLESTYILRPDWYIQAFQTTLSELPLGISLDIVYMILNSVDMHWWKLQDRETIKKETERIDFWKFAIGMNLVEVESSITGVNSSIARAKEQYISRLK